MFIEISRRKSPSVTPFATSPRNASSSASVRFRTATSGAIPVDLHISNARVRPIPYMCVKATHTCFRSGILTPAIRAISIRSRYSDKDGSADASRPSALPLLVSCILADDPHRSFAPDYLAVPTQPLHRRPDLHIEFPRFVIAARQLGHIPSDWPSSTALHTDATSSAIALVP